MTLYLISQHQLMTGQLSKRYRLPEGGIIDVTFKMAMHYGWSTE
jgi:hypothetical protein